MPDRSLSRGAGGSRQSQEARILRAREADLRRDMDIDDGDHIPLTTPRMLVQIYDQGSIPTDPDHMFAAHPVTLGGDECEGCTPTQGVDSSTVYVDVLWHAAVAGDILTAYAVGGRWVAEKSGGTCTVNICLYQCDSTNSPITSASVTIKDGGGSTIFTGTTDATTGCINNISIPGAGTYSVHVTKTGFDSTANATLPCSGTKALSWEPPTPLPLTDANGTISLFKVANAPPTWQGGYYHTMTSVGVVDISGLGDCFANLPTSSGPVLICYTVVCNSDGTLTVTRSWETVQERFAGWDYVQNSTTTAPSQGNPCPFDYGGFFCAVGRVVAESSAKTASPSSAAPFAWSGTLTANPGNNTSDPVGGTVTLG